MWKILGVLVFCGLQSPALGSFPGIRAVINQAKLSEVLIDTWTQDGLLASHLKSLGLSDIRLGRLLSLVDNIVGLKIDEFILTSYRLVLLNEKAETNLSIHLGTSGNTILPFSSLITISIDVNVKFVAGINNFSDGKFDFIISACEVTLGAIDVKLLGGFLTLSEISTIQKSLTADLQRQLCPIVQHVCDAVKLVWLNSVNVVLPLGAYGNLKFQLSASPPITTANVGIDLSVLFQNTESGKIVSIPDKAVSIAVPSLDNYAFCLAISPDTFNILLYVVTPKVPLELINSPAVFSKAEELKNALLALVPSESDLSLKITIRASPVIAFSTTGATANLVADVEILGKKADGSQVSVVVVRCNVSLKVIITLVNDKLILGLSLSKNVLTLVSSGTGITDVSSLLGPINDLVNEILLPVFSAPLSLGLPLPPILDIPLVNTTIKTVMNALVICL